MRCVALGDVFVRHCHRGYGWQKDGRRSESREKRRDGIARDLDPNEYEPSASLESEKDRIDSPTLGSLPVKTRESVLWLERMHKSSAAADVHRMYTSKEVID